MFRSPTEEKKRSIWIPDVVIVHNNQSIVGLCVQHLGFLYRRCLTSLKKRVSGKSLKKNKGRKKK